MKFKLRFKKIGVRPPHSKHPETSQPKRQPKTAMYEAILDNPRTNKKHKVLIRASDRLKAKQKLQRKYPTFYFYRDPDKIR